MLDGSNYELWCVAIEASFYMKGSIRIVDGSESKPDASKAEEVKTWNKLNDHAVGLMLKTIDLGQRTHFNGAIGIASDMWKKLEAVHRQKQPVNRFIAYQDLFSIYKGEDETLPALVARVKTASNRVKLLRPKDDKTYDLDDELACMVLIRALPEAFSSFRSSLMMSGTLDLEKLVNAFYQEEKTRNDLHATSSALALSAQTKTARTCNFCGRKGHLEADCYKKAEYSKRCIEEAAQQKKQNKSKKGKAKSANVASDAPQTGSSDTNQSSGTQEEAAEFAGNTTLGQLVI